MPDPELVIRGTMLFYNSAMDRDVPLADERATGLSVPATTARSQSRTLLRRLANALGGI